MAEDAGLGSGAYDAPEDAHYVLRLYVTGMTPRSTQALDTIKVDSARP